jgi:DNA polymerase-3 subunit delta
VKEFQSIKNDIQQKAFKPVYYFHGEESYFLDQLSHLIEAQALEPHETDFNKEVFYGADAKASQVLSACRSFPMMAERRLVMLKEAQRFPKPEMEKLVSYLKQPSPTTVFVMVFKGKKGSLPKAGVSALKKAGGVNFYSKKMWDRDVKAWLHLHLKELSLEADPEIPEIMVTNLGTNLGHLANEIEKMHVYLQASKQPRLSKEFVFEQIDIDKDFNVFELISALAQRRVKQAHLIIDRMSQNSKSNPPVMIVGGLFRFFDQVAQVYSQKVTDLNTARSQLGFNYGQARDAIEGRRNYSLGLVYRNIGFIQDADLMIKGQIPTRMSQQHILKTLVWQILN